MKLRYGKDFLSPIMQQVIRLLTPPKTPEVIPDLPGYHKHHCEKCDTVFTHSNMTLFMSSEEFDESHTCPMCHSGLPEGPEGGIEKYRGERHAVCMNGPRV